MNTAMPATTSYRNLMEVIVLLYMLNQFPENERGNQQPQGLPMSSLYQLPLQCEKEVVDNLAFLSATTNDSTRVTAVCLEESADHRSCIIRLASNTGNLDEVAHGLEHVARVLQQAASRGMQCYIDSGH